MRINFTWLLIFSVLLLPLRTGAQTAGTMTLTFTTNSTGGFSPKHLVAVWVENSSNAFVKTKLKRASNGNLDHLSLWTTNSGSNVVDAVTGATITAHGPLTVTWNGTAVSGALVPDGNYTVWVEMAWAQDYTTGKTHQTYTFLKGPDSVHLTPSGNSNLSGITLDWVPTASSTDETAVDQDIKVYPNPTTGLIYLALNAKSENTTVRVMNLTGALVYREFFPDPGPALRTINLSKFTPGIYFIRVENSESHNFKIVLN